MKHTKPTRNLKKLLALVAIFPLLASCGSLSTATISSGLDRKRLTYDEAKEAIANGANVRDDWAGQCFLKEAAEQKRWDLVILFIENGANPWDAPRGKHKPFSTFNFIIDPSRDIPTETRLQILDACLAHKDESPVVAEQQTTAYVEDRNARPGEFRSAALSKIAASGLAAASIEKLRQQEIEKATKDLLRACSDKTLTASEVNTLVAIGANVNATTDKGYSVLFVAEQRKQPAEVLTALVAAGAVKNDLDIAAEHQLAENAKKQAEEATEMLVSKAKNKSLSMSELSVLVRQGANVNATDEDGHSVLFLVEQDASSEGENRRFRGRNTAEKKNLSSTLIAAGAKKNKLDESAELIELCKASGDVDEDNDAPKVDPQKIKALIDNGVDVNTHDKDGNTALLLAEIGENTEIISLLKNAGAKMDPGEEEKLKADATEKLFRLAGKGDSKNAKEKAELYISRGADVNAKNEKGASVLGVALFTSAYVRGMRALIDNTAKETSGGMENVGKQAAAVMNSALGEAPKGGIFEDPLCVVLTNAGAKASNDELTTIYFLSLKLANWAAVKELKDRGFDLRSEDKSGKNAFHVLSENEYVTPNESVVNTLVKAGVNMEKKAEFDDVFLTPLGYAIQNKHMGAVRVLLEHGANPKATAIIKDVMENRSISLTDFARDKYNKAKNTRDLLRTQRMTPDNVQAIKALDAALRDYQQIILML